MRRRRTFVRGRRVRRRIARGSGPVGTVRRFATRAVRELPLYAPLRRLPRREMKYHDNPASAAAADTTGDIRYLSEIPQGDSVQTREGQRVTVLAILARGRAVANAATTVTLAQLMLVYDRQPNGTSPSILAILETVSPLALQQADSRDRFEILGRWTFNVIGNATAPATGAESHMIELNIACRKQLVYDQSVGSGAITSARTGALYAVVTGFSPPGTGAATIYCGYRVMFADS